MTTFDANKYTVPEGFPDLLRSFAKEVLRNQPSDIYAFGYQYFSDLERKRKEARTESDVMRRVLEDGFKSYATGNTVDARSFCKVISSFDTPLTRPQYLYVIGKAVLVEDGLIDYTAFLPSGIEALRSPPPTIEGYTTLRTLFGLDRNLLGNKLHDAAQQIAKPSDIIPLLESLDLGLTSVESRSTAVEAIAAYSFPITGETMEEFYEFVLDHLEFVAQYSVDPKRRMRDSEWSIYLSNLLADNASRWGIRNCLLDSDLGLSSKQVIIVMSEYEDDSSDMEPFYNAAAKHIAGWNDPTQTKLSLLWEHVPSDANIRGFTRDQVEDVLRQGFLRADREGEGILAVQNAKAVLASCPLQLKKREIAALLTIMEQEDVDFYNYESVPTSAFDLLYMLERYDNN